MAKRNKKMITVFMTGISICLLLFISLQTSIITTQVRKTTTNQYIELCRQIVKARADEINSWNKIYVNDLRIFTDNPVIKSGDVEMIKSWINEHRAMKNNLFANSFFCDITGNTYQFGPESSTYVADRSYYKAIMENGVDTYIADPIFSRAISSYVIMIARAAKDSKGKTFGFFAGSVRPDTISVIVNSIKLGEKGRAFILAGDGTVLAHWDTEKIMKANFLTDQYKDTQGLSDIAKSMISGKSSFDYYHNEHGKMLVVFEPIKETSWALGIEVPVSQINQASRLVIITIVFLSFFIIVALLTFSIVSISRIVKPLRVVESTIIGIAQGDADLTKRVDVVRDDEIGRLVDGFNLFAEKLQTIVGNVMKSKNRLAAVEVDLKQSVENTGCSITEILFNIESVSHLIETQSEGVEETVGAVTKIAQNIKSLENMIQNQAAGVAEASASVEEMIGNINSVDSSIVKMATEFSQLANEARKGIDKQSDVNETIRTIASQSEMLQEANAAIAGIASQTNMLAMNAAIEAAHAGDAGRGFSVVADEIRKLSETSSEQSKTIGEELNKIITALESVVISSQDSEETFNSLSVRLMQTDEIMHLLREAMIEQQTGSKQILSALQTMNESTHEVRSASAEMASGNKSILEEIKILQDSTTIIKDSINEMTEGARTINETGAQLHSISKEVSDSIKEIGKQIDLFKV
ncbi:MAG: methyl-accepting chemotaxis protein [Treponema sp.]|nr:methyl-accepting chemotaxis protein [Treponema sp.]